MTKRYTAEDRQVIIDLFIAEHGSFDPAVFVEEARSDNHPAHDWFTWDDNVAAERYRVWQARQFVHVRVVTRIVDSGTAEVEVSRPEYVAQQSHGVDGYIPVSSPDGEAELRWQALDSGFGFRSCLRRYESVMLEDEVKAAESLIRRIERNNAKAA